MTVSHDDPSGPLPLSEEEIDRALDQALATLPPALAGAMDNVAIFVQDEPDPDMLTDEDYDEDGLPTLLGLYDGTPLTQRDDGWNLALPDRVLLFTGPLSRWCRTPAELSEQIGVTLLHELAHHFGLDDDRLTELGWD